MNKKIKWALIPVIGAALVAAMVPWTLSSHALRRELASQVKSAIGFTTDAKGRSTFALLPRPRIKLEDVTLSAPDGGFSLRADVVKAELRILPLLTGHLELSSITLVSADMSVDLDKPLHIGGSIAEAMKPGATASLVKSAQFGVVSIVSGTAHFISDLHRHQAEVENINATLDWRRLTSPAMLNGTVNWRGTDADIALWINKPAALLHGNTSPIDLKIDSAAGSLTMDGTLVSQPALQYDGRIAAYAPLLREAMQLFNVSVPLPGPLRDARLTAQARIESSATTLSDTHISLDGNVFEGSLAMHKDRGRRLWSGTLATDLFALSPFVTDLAPAITPDGQWNREAIDASNLDFGDLDLRLSAGRAHLGRLLLENAGFSILLNQGKLEVTLADANAYGGTLKGRANVSRGPEGVDAQLSANFLHIDSAAFLNDVLRGTHISGDATGQIAFEGHGETLAAITQSLDGQAQLNLTNGEISGIDLEQALRRMEKRPLSIATEVRTGRTGFSVASGKFHIAAGTLQIDQCSTSGPGADISVTGAAGIGNRSLNLHVAAYQTGTPPASADAPQLHLDVTGSWDDPLMILDTASLISRSAVAAPLLRSLSPSNVPFGTMDNNASPATAAAVAPSK